ncbi:MAG: hypothetical protein ACREJ9_13435 [Candidatus Rokuibacteriota bacterium]
MLTTGCSVASQSADVKDLVQRRYQLSRMALEPSGRQGIVTRRGTVLVLGIDGVPANALRVIRPAIYPPQSFVSKPVRHLDNYAPVRIPADGPLPEARDEFTLPRGTRLVVLDRKVERDRVRLFTHTLEPIRRADGTTACGCTEFIFPLERTEGTAALHRRIDRVLSPAA